MVPFLTPEEIEYGWDASMKANIRNIQRKAVEDFLEKTRFELQRINNIIRDQWPGGTGDDRADTCHAIWDRDRARCERTIAHGMSVLSEFLTELI